MCSEIKLIILSIFIKKCYILSKIIEIQNQEVSYINLKNRKIIKIGIIIITITAIIAIITAYINTDFLKTKEQLFWKYFILEKNKIVTVFSNKEIQEFNQNLKISSYIKEGNFSITSKYNLIKPINVDISEKGDNQQEIKNTDINLKYNDKDIGNINIIKDDNYILIKNDKTKLGYIGFKNENLKQLAKKLGLANTEFIPNKIQEIDFFELLSLSDDEGKYILKKYVPICRKYVKNKDYNIEKNVGGKEEKLYKVQVSNEQLKNIMINILEELENDEITLEIISNKIKVMDNENEYTSIDKIKSKINEFKEKIEQLKTTDENFLSIIIYKNANNVEKMEIIVEDGRNISIEIINENKILIKQSNNLNDKQIDLKNFKGILTTLINTVDEVTYEKKIINGKEKTVDINVICNVGLETINLKYNYVEKIENNVEGYVKMNEVNYTELEKVNIEMLKLLVEKILF